MTPVLAFDIETIPDVVGIRRLYDLPAELPDVEVAEVAFQKRRTVSNNDFLPPHLQRIIVISCVLRHDDEVRVFSIGEPDAAEDVAIQRFFEGLNKYVPQIVSWNGRNFDLPVLVARGLIHGVPAACFWDTGQDNKDAKWANYINRFHDRHLDLMDVLSMYGSRGSPLDELAKLSGFPGKLGIGGAAVWESYRQGAIASIRAAGRGVARKPDGKVLFVEGALPGERVRVEIVRGKRRHEFAHAVAIEAPSPARRAPRCPHFGVCGGCASQHASLAAQLAAKQDGLLQNLARIGKVEPERVLPALSGPEWGYRHRARLSVRRVPQKGGVLVGFRERRSTYVADLRECPVLPEHLSSLIVPLRALVETLSVRARLPQIEVAVADNATALVFRHLRSEERRV